MAERTPYILQQVNPSRDEMMEAISLPSMRKAFSQHGDFSSEEKLKEIMRYRPVLFTLIRKTECLGYCAGYRTELNFFICLLCVVEKGKGYGKRLFLEAKGYAKKYNFEELVLGTHPENLAVEFYKKLLPSWIDTDKKDEVTFGWSLSLPPKTDADIYNTQSKNGIEEIAEISNTANVHCIITTLERKSSYPTEISGRTIFAIGSISKLFMAVAFHIFMRTPLMKVQWHHKVSSHLNLDFSPHEPTIEDLLHHRNCLPSMNDVLLGPGGDVLISTKEQFMNAAQALLSLRGHGKKNYVEYSNGNTILLGFLIEKYTGMPVTKFLQQFLIEPLNLDRTCLTQSDFERMQDYVVKPTITEGSAYDGRYFGLLLPAMGVWSSVEDVNTLLRAIIDEKEKIWEGRLSSSLGTWQFLKWAGRKIGYNYALSPSSNYALGESSSEERVLHCKGNVNGYNTSIYIIPKFEIAIAVLTTSSGLIDSADHISRYILQKLWSSLLDKNVVKTADILHWVRVGIEEAESWLKTYFPPIPPTAAYDALQRFPELEGLFRDQHGLNQFIRIRRIGDHYEILFAGNVQQKGNWLWLYKDQERECTLLIRPRPGVPSKHLGIDIIDAWFRLSITVRGINELSRDTTQFSITYNRLEQGDVIMS